MDGSKYLMHHGEHSGLFCVFPETLGLSHCEPTCLSCSVYWQRGVNPYLLDSFITRWPIMRNHDQQSWEVILGSPSVWVGVWCVWLKTALWLICVVSWLFWLFSEHSALCSLCVQTLLWTRKNLQKNFHHYHLRNDKSSNSKLGTFLSSGSCVCGIMVKLCQATLCCAVLCWAVPHHAVMCGAVLWHCSVHWFFKREAAFF